MPAMSLRDLVKKLNDSVMADADIDKDAMIRSGYVCGKTDREYPEGTVVFELVSNNTSVSKINESTHELAIYPDKLGMIN